MSTHEYGDVLCRPSIRSVDYANYFEPLGKSEDFAKVFNFTNGSNPIDYNGVVYCYPTNGVVGSGILYNKKYSKKPVLQFPAEQKTSTRHSKQSKKRQTLFPSS